MRRVSTSLSVTRGLLTICCVLLLSQLAVGQDVPFNGVVEENNVQVRAGAGRAYYVVGQLDAGTVVQVDEVIFGWNKIKAPQGIHSYISKAFVDARGDGRTGEVNSDRVDVKAASVQGPGESYRVQMVLNKGATVRIVGEEGSFYKIIPPDETYVYLPPGSVRRASAMEQAVVEEPAVEVPVPAETPEPAPQPEPQPEQPVVTVPQPEPAQEPTEPAAEQVEQPAVEAEPAATQPEWVPPQPEPIVAAVEESVIEVEPADQTAVTETPAPAETVTPAGPVETPAVSEALRTVEQKYLPKFELPVDQQPIDEMIAAYRQVQLQDLSVVDQRIVRSRLAVLERNRRLADAIGKISQARKEAEEAAAALTPDEVQTPPVQFDAVGRLLASRVYNGESLPRMFRLVDPTSGRTIAYVEPSGLVAAGQMLGKLVGIVGDQGYEPALKLQIIKVEQIHLLEAAPQ